MEGQEGGVSEGQAAHVVMPRAAGKEWVASSARRTRLVFKALGFTVAYKGKDIEEGIALYEQGGMDCKSVKE